MLDRLADAAEPKRSQRVGLTLVGAVARFALGDGEGAHDDDAAGDSPVSAGDSLVSAVGAVVSAAGAVVSADPSAFSVVRPSTWLIDRPRSSATSRGVRSDSSPAIVALTRLIGFWEPRLLERMSWMPASSSTARTPPPAITPVPGAAGFRNTRPAPNTPVVWWVIVEPCLGTRKSDFFAASTPFWIASGTSLALP